MFNFRLLTRADFPLLQRWLCEPHVDAWWDQPLDLAGVEIKYGPRVDGAEPTYVFIIENNEHPIGLIQWYRWADYPQHGEQLAAEPGTAGIDIAIGQPDMIGSGLGPKVIRDFLKEIVLADPLVKAVITDIEAANTRSLRAFEKVGFLRTKTVHLRGEATQRAVMRLNR